ncbi:YceI family protein [Flavobacterium sp. '19STA2R22 D10 B1']|uniref:YceI family protein n=1 Tax=Flavobacterium aerium TaxID=3037261 RepID=UPI00278C3083|nr:YceI family protein [Flavobacterium sp. '19STA2R22 D10 B1']
MKQLKLITVVVLFLTTMTGFAQQTWKNDPMHSRLGFTTTHMLISDINGIFKTFELNMVATKEDFSDAKVELKADISSIDTEVEPRDNHLRSPDFFDAAQYTTLNFKSTSIQKISKDKYKLKGNLTIHNITKPVEVEMVYRGTIVNPNSNKKTAGFQFKGLLKRLDFNVGTTMPETLISNDVKIAADAELILQ